MVKTVDYSFEDMGREPVPLGDPMLNEMFYTSGVKPPGPPGGTPAEKKAYAAYYAKRESGVPYETLLNAD